MPSKLERSQPNHLGKTADMGATNVKRPTISTNEHREIYLNFFRKQLIVSDRLF